MNPPDEEPMSRPPTEEDEELEVEDSQTVLNHKMIKKGRVKYQKLPLQNPR